MTEANQESNPETKPATKAETKPDETLRLVRDVTAADGAGPTLVSVVEFGPGVLSIEAPFSSPPGSRVSLRIERVGQGAAGVIGVFGLKVHACKRNEAGAFVIGGRPIDLRKEGSAALVSMTPTREGKNIGGGANEGVRGDRARGVHESAAAGRRLHRGGVR